MISGGTCLWKETCFEKASELPGSGSVDTARVSLCDSSCSAEQRAEFKTTQMSSEYSGLSNSLRALKENPTKFQWRERDALCRPHTEPGQFVQESSHTSMEPSDPPSCSPPICNPALALASKARLAHILKYPINACVDNEVHGQGSGVSTVRGFAPPKRIVLPITSGVFAGSSSLPLEKAGYHGAMINSSPLTKARIRH